jgi:ribonuclease HIII
MSQITIKIPKERLDVFIEQLRKNLMIIATDTKNEYERFRGIVGSKTIVAYTSGKVVYGDDPTVQRIIRSILDDFTKGGSFAIVIGSDEAGKGEWLGPMTVAAVALDSAGMSHLQAQGVMDSKELSLESIRRLTSVIQECAVHTKTLTITPTRFNVLQAEMKKEGKSLNDLLAWAHKTVIDSVLVPEVLNRGRVEVVIDEFDRIKTSLELDKIKERRELTVIQMPRAEELVSVAAASILARSAREEWLDRETRRLGIDLRKLDPLRVLDMPTKGEIVKISYLEHMLRNKQSHSH